MSNLKKISSAIINSFLGMLLVIIFIFPAKFLEEISRKIMVFLLKIFSYFDFTGTGGGYLDLFYEKFIVEVMAAGVYCATLILIPIYLNKKFFNKIKIVWLPSLILVFLFFSTMGIMMIGIFILGITKLDWTDLIQFLLTIFGFFGGYLSVLYVALEYGNITHPWLNKIIKRN
jgi:hypothetical protein